MSKPFVVGNQLLVVCDDCGKLIRLNKPLLGSLHLCLTEEERLIRDGQKKYEEQRPLDEYEKQLLSTLKEPKP